MIWYRDTMRYFDFVKVGVVHLEPRGFGVFAFHSRVLLRLERGFRRPTIASTRFIQRKRLPKISECPLEETGLGTP
jgi:hypothetical protein